MSDYTFIQEWIRNLKSFHARSNRNLGASNSPAICRSPDPGQSQLLYIFGLIIVGVLAADFYSRAKKEEKIFKFLLRNFYEILAMIPIVAFVPFGGQGVTGAFYI